MLKINIKTLGCKVNQTEGDALATELLALGYDVVEYWTEADVFVINSCTVTHKADGKARKLINKAKQAGCFVALCGCRGDVPDVDFIFDSREPMEFFEKLKEIKPKSRKSTEAIQRKTRTRAFIKVQDGCDRFCSYCIVPYKRKKLYSKPPKEAIAEIKTAVDAGVLEVVLTGIQLAGYCIEESGEFCTFADLLPDAAKVPGLKRLRLSSLAPDVINEKFIDVIRENDNICDHFHLSLQSGCDKILELMNRRYTTAEFADKIKKLRKVRPNAGITTDVIVGFPGESDEDFARSMDFILQMNFSRVHVFTFSSRKDTKAASMCGKVSQNIINSRAKTLSEELKKQQDKRDLNGKIFSVLFEEKTAENAYSGYATNYMHVTVQSEINLCNQIRNVIFNENEIARIL